MPVDDPRMRMHLLTRRFVKLEKALADALARIEALESKNADKNDDYHPFRDA